MSHEFWLGLVIGITVGEILQLIRGILLARLDRVSGGKP